MKTKEFGVECVEWKLDVNEDGYGYFRVMDADDPDEIWLAHEFSYRVRVGPIPDGMVVHHKCCNRLCINEKHLVLMTRDEHARAEKLGRSTLRLVH